MNIVYGVFGPSYGHIIRSSIMIDLLLARGHEVIIVTPTGGMPYFTKHYSDLSIFETPNFKFHHDVNGLNFAATAAEPINQTSQVFTTTFVICDEIQKQFGHPDIVFNDLEMVTSQIAYVFDVPLIGISRSTAFLSHDYPELSGFTVDAGRTLTAMIYPKTAAMFNPLIFKPDFPKLEGYDVTPVPPIIRKEIHAVVGTPVDPKKILVYVTNYKHLAYELEPMLATLKELNDFEFRVYNDDIEPHQDGNVAVAPFDRYGFPEQLASSSAVIGTGGSNLIAESIYLRKPYFAVPFGFYEQVVNSTLLQRSGVGEWGFEPSAERLREFLGRLPEFKQNFRDNQHFWDRFDGEDVVMKQLNEQFGL